MKKFLVLLLATTLVSGLLVGCGGNDAIIDDGPPPASEASPETPAADVTTEPEPPAPEAVKSNVANDTFLVAYSASMNGDFIWGFGNNAYDLSIKQLLHGDGAYSSPYAVTPGGEFIVNETIVKDLAIETDDVGNKTYTFEIHNDLKWSDGSSITAEDYVFMLLWSASPQWAEAGAVSSAGYGLLGYGAYNGGESDVFAGVKLIGDYIFSMTIDADELPYFYEVSYVSPYPMCKATYAPGVAITSSDAGAGFAGDIFPDCERIVSTSGGERYAPTVVSGPYTFVSFDNQIITLQKNPYFKGDMNGKLPYFEYIVQQQVPQETDVDMLLAGDIDLLPAEVEGEKIERARAGENTTVSSYLRNGYGVMNFVHHWGPTADVNVRWAISCLVDRTQLLDQVLGGYGGLVDSELGASQWMYQLKERELRAALKPIAMNIDKANEYLDQTEWLYEADGTTPFDVSKVTADASYLRHNANGDPLIIYHAGANASVGAILEIEFLKNTPLAGIKYNFDLIEFSVLLDEYYDGHGWPEDELTYSSYAMGSGFPAVYDPYFMSWHSDWVGTDYNPMGVSDALLDELMMAMRQVDPADKAKFADLWFDYQVRWNEILPSIPLYSNEYFNLFNTTVKSVNTTPFLDWYDIICDIEKF